MIVKNKISASIISGATRTNPILINEESLAGIVVTGSMLSGSITFLVSNDNVTYYPLFDVNAVEVIVKTGSSPRAYFINHDNFEAWDYIKIRQGTSASDVAVAGGAPAIFEIVTVNE